MTNLTGGCLCGQVRYTITGEPIRSGICHCRSCQHYTGSAFEPFMIFPPPRSTCRANCVPSARSPIPATPFFGGSAQTAVQA